VLHRPAQGVPGPLWQQRPDGRHRDRRHDGRLARPPARGRGAPAARPGRAELDQDGPQVHPGHLLAVEVHLRPVLVELGASVPSRGLYVTEPELADLDKAIARWSDAALPLI